MWQLRVYPEQDSRPYTVSGDGTLVLGADQRKYLASRRWDGCEYACNTRDLYTALELDGTS